VDLALSRGNDFLGSLSLNPNLKVRTGRYVKVLRTTLNELRKETAHP
jgi:hypothetical protein